MAAELAAEIVNGKHDLDLPLARTEGLPGLGGASCAWGSGHQGKPELGQTEAERLILPLAQVERAEVTRSRVC